MDYNEQLINKLRDILTGHSETISIAESVTGGHLQAAMSLAQDASMFYQGGITAYNLGQKTRHLNIDPICADKSNCVDSAVAEKMALEVSNMFCSTFGLSITGYASAVPGVTDAGLFAFAAIAEDSKVVFSEKITSREQLPYKVQIEYANVLLQKFYDYLTKRE